MDKRNIHIALPSVGDEEWEATRECFESGWLTTGPKVAAFEQAFAQRHGAQHGIAVTSCTTGLHLCLAALGVGPGDEVIVPAFSWVATANVVCALGARPVFVDVERETFNIDVSQVAAKVSPRTRAIMPVHLFGLCADIDALREVIPDNIAIIGDAACAAGATYKGRSAGSLCDIEVFSLHPRKIITTGEGGMITTNNGELAEKVHRLKNHGASLSEEQRHRGPKPYLLPTFEELGYNYRMTDMQGAVGLVQLSKLDSLLTERRKWTGYYVNAFQDVKWLKTPSEPTNGQHGWQSFVCYVDPDLAPDERNIMMEHLQESGISTRPGTHAIHMLDYYQNCWGTTPDQCPAARDCDRQSLALPLHNRMSAEDYAYVVEQIHKLSETVVKAGV